MNKDTIEDLKEQVARLRVCNGALKSFAKECIEIEAHAEKVHASDRQHGQVATVIIASRAQLRLAKEIADMARKALQGGIIAC